MAALHDDGAELGEELRMLGAEENAEAPRGGSSRRRKAAFVAVGLGLAAAAAYAAAPGRSQIPAASVAGLQGKAEERPKLAVEQDLGSFISAESLPEDAHPGALGGSVTSSASKLFEHVVEKSHLWEEMTGEELRAFKYRFMSSMIEMVDSKDGPQEAYLERARKHVEGAKPVMTKALADAVNTDQSSFKVEMKDWMLDESMDSLNSRLIKVPFSLEGVRKGRHFEKSLPQEHGLRGGSVPSHFDSAEHWPDCAETVRNPHNQGRCGSCWVFGASGSLDSRMCIATKGEYSGSLAALSRGFGTSCVSDGDGCQGGWPHWVFDYIESHAGIPPTSCVPYFGGSDYSDHWSSSMPAPACPSAGDSRFPGEMSENLFKPSGVGAYQLVTRPDAAGIENMKHAILEGGPVPYAFYANSVFMGYSGGVFNSGCGENANHAVQATGWGREEGQEYILSLNSWGTDWGLKGAFKVARCVVWHFVIPGDIENTDYPLPVPSQGQAADHKKGHKKAHKKAHK